MPTLFAILLVLIARSVTLPGAGKGLEWYVGKFAFSDLSPTVIVAAMGQAIFSLSLGGTFMVTYGSYLPAGDDLAGGAVWTTVGDTLAGLMAGFVIFPAVFAFGMEPASGPALLFDTIPRVFAQMPGGALFGLLFFMGLFGAAYLSDVAAFEVLIAGLTDNTSMSRRRAVWTTAGVVFLVALIPMTNMRVFVPWDLTFGSGMQSLGALLAVVTAGWFVNRGAMLAELQQAGGRPRPFLMLWIRYVIPLGMLSVGVWWLLTDVLGVIGRV
jgi:NSS family neurotransmitter:Na+ symporter